MRAWSLEVRQRLATEHVSPSSSTGGIAGWLNSIVAGLNHILTGSLAGFLSTETDWAKLVLWWDRQAAHGYGAVATWLVNGIIAFLESLIGKLYARLRGELAALKRQLIADDIYGLRAAIAFARRAVNLERLSRLREGRWIIADYRTRIKWLHQNIEKEAVSGYALAQKDRANVIIQVADLIANYAPVTRRLVHVIVRGVLDLLVVDDPVLRITLGFVMGHIIKRLGLDKPIGHLLDRLLSSLLGTGKPKGLHDVIADICARLTAGEQQWADFMANGGSEILQAGDEWQALTSLPANAALLGLVATMAVAPNAFARDLAGTVGIGLNDTIGAVVRLIEKG
jgi:hypothetical protein